MKSKTFSSLLVGCVVFVGAGSATSFLVVGCGGDDSGTETGDAAADSNTDGPSVDAHSDVTVPDSGTDASPHDAALDSPTMMDGSIDAADASDASDGSIAPDATGLQASQYASAIEQTLCTRLAACCELDAATFDIAGCVAIFGGNPVGVGEATPYLDSGLVSFNTVQAGTCLDEFANFPCGSVNAMQNVMLGQDCLAAFTGTQVTNGACLDSIECSGTEYCALPGDGGAGVCTPLAGDGGACGNDNQCSYLGSGIPALFCDSVTNICMPQLANGADCTGLDQCQSQICRGTPTKTCGSTYVFSDPGQPGGTCATFTLDAGGD